MPELVLITDEGETTAEEEDWACLRREMSNVLKQIISSCENRLENRGCQGSECGCLTLLRKATAESGESAVSLKPCKFIIMCLHLAKMMIDGKVILNEIISYK